MNKAWIKYIVLIAVAGLLAYNSVYIKKLDTKKEAVSTKLSPEQFAQNFWTTQFTPYLDSAVEIHVFMQQLKADSKKAITEYSKTQGIGSTANILLKGEGVITAVNDDNVIVSVKSGDNTMNVKLNTGIYFGNAVRDVTGKISMGDFTNTMDYNTVSSTLNKIVQTQIVQPFKTKATKSAILQFVGCAEINIEQINADNIQLLPVQIKFK
jgi:predicted lipoprotein